MTADELSVDRRKGHKVYGWFSAYCCSQGCCDNCDKIVRFGCKLKTKIEAVQTKRILQIYKEEDKEQ